MQVNLSGLSGVWSYPTEVRFGPGRIPDLADTRKRIGMARPMLVTDPGLAESPMVGDAALALEAAGLAADLFSDMEPNPLSDDDLRDVFIAAVYGRSDVRPLKSLKPRTLLS